MASGIPSRDLREKSKTMPEENVVSFWQVLSAGGMVFSSHGIFFTIQ